MRPRRLAAVALTSFALLLPPEGGSHVGAGGERPSWLPDTVSWLPDSTSYENIVTPVWTGTHLVASTSAAGLRGYTVRQVGGMWQAAEAWKNAEASMYMSTPVLADGVLYGLSNKKKGQIVAVDAATGALKWATEGRAADQAAILLTPAHVLVLTTGGELVLVRRTPAKYEEERRYTVADSATWAVPVLLPDGLIVRDASGVMRLTGS